MEEKIGLTIMRLASLFNRTSGKGFVNSTITRKQLRIASYIEMHPGATQKDLEMSFSFTRSACSQIISTMESNDLLTRSLDTVDKRVKHLSLTTHGIDAVREMESHVNSIEDYLESRLDEDDKRSFLALSRRIKMLLEGYKC